MADPTNISESEEDEEIKRQLREGQLVLPGDINFNKERRSETANDTIHKDTITRTAIGRTNH